MNSRITSALLASSIFLLSTFLGCASTKLTSKVNSSFADYRFRKLMVFGNFPNLEYRQLAEEKLCSDIQKKSQCQCVKSLDVFFPAQEYSADEVQNQLRLLNIDGFLTLQATGAGTTSAYIPRTTQTTGTAYINGNTVTGSSKTQEYGGYSLSKPWANYEVVLRSTENGSVAWYATAVSKGDVFTDWDNLIKSASGKTVNRLVDEGLLSVYNLQQSQSLPETYENYSIETIDRNKPIPDRDDNSILSPNRGDESYQKIIGEPVYLDIVSIVKNNFAVVLQTEDHQMHLGENYEIVKPETALNSKQIFTTIGSGTVVLVEGNKVALKCKITGSDIFLSKDLKIMFR